VDKIPPHLRGSRVQTPKEKWWDYKKILDLKVEKVIFL
jgi:hypothetical protein